MKILVLYYSGVGNTKMVAEKLFSLFEKQYEVTIANIEKFSETIEISNYDALVIGFPTIHATPAQPILMFLRQMDVLFNGVPAFIFTTCGLYPANTLRIFAKECRNRNIIPVMSKSYRCAATDGSLIAPFMSFWFHHEKKLNKKIQKDVIKFITLLNKKIMMRIPRFKLYSVLNYPNKVCGKRFSPNIYTYKDNCIKCNKCIINCPIQIINKDDQGYPIIENNNCIHCYRCIHHCPSKALSLSKKNPPMKTLNY